MRALRMSRERRAHPPQRLRVPRPLRAPRNETVAHRAVSAFARAAATAIATTTAAAAAVAAVAITAAAAFDGGAQWLHERRPQLLAAERRTRQRAARECADRGRGRNAHLTRQRAGCVVET